MRSPQPGAQGSGQLGLASQTGLGVRVLGSPRTGPSYTTYGLLIGVGYGSKYSHPPGGLSFPNCCDHLRISSGVANPP